MNDALPKPPHQLSLFDPWDPAALHFTSHQQELIPALRAWLLQLDSPIARVLCGKAESWTVANMGNLEHSILARFKPAQEAAEILRILLKVLGRLNEFRQDPLPLPSIPIFSPPPPSYFHQNLPGALRRCQAWGEAQDGWLQKNAAVASSRPAVDLERVLVSAALYGGLFDASSLVALARSLADSPANSLLLGSFLYSGLSLPWQGIPDSQLRGWTADPATAALIVRLPEHPAPWVLDLGLTDATLKKRLGQRIRRLFRSAGIALDQCPSSIRDFTETIALANRTAMPSVLVNFASRRIISHSLPSAVLLRLFGQIGPTAPTSKKNIVPRADADGAILLEDLADRTDYEPPWLRDLRDRLSTYRQGHNRTWNSHARKGEAEGKAGNPPVALRMTEFADYLALGSSQKPALQPRTVAEYALAVAKRLGCLLDGEDPAALSLSSLESLYLQVLENTDHADAPRGLRPRVAVALDWFHKFLMTRYRVQKLTEPGLLGRNAGLSKVDANLITIEEYQSILNGIQNLPIHRDAKRVARLLVILGFRCGLRRNEALKLRTVDVQCEGQALLLIRRWKLRGLKTRAARRDLPLLVLLTPGELEELHTWKRDRLHDGSSDNPFLFSIPAIAPGLLPARALFAKIHRVMRGETSDPTLHYHHLRHSFASWLFYRLMISGLRAPIELFPHLPDTTRWIQQSKDFREKLYRHNFPTRKHTYAVASLLGHAGPDISVQYYIHSFDWVLHSFLGQARTAPTKRKVVLASGRAESTVYSWLDSTPLAEATRRLFQSRFPQAKTESSNANLRLEAPGHSTDADYGWVQAVWNVLHEHSRAGTPLGELSGEFELEQMERMHRRALSLHALRSGREGYRHRMTRWVRDRRLPEQHERLCCPLWPHLRTDQDVVRLLAPRIRKLLEAEPATCAKVLDRYVHQIWHRNNLLIFQDSSDPKSAQAYLDFLEGLGVERRDTRFVSFDRSARSKWRRKWRDTLGLNARHGIEKRSPPNASNTGAAQWLGIEPVFNRNAPKQKDSPEKNDSEVAIVTPSNNSTGSYGYRFLMVMTDIFLAGEVPPATLLRLGA